MKRIEFRDSGRGILAVHIWGSVDLVFLEVILGCIYLKLISSNIGAKFTSVVRTAVVKQRDQRPWTSC